MNFSSRDVKQFIQAHEKYLHGLSKKCFLIHPALMNTFLAVLESVEKFTKNPTLELHQEFNTTSRYFFELIEKKNLNSRNSESYLAALALVLNYNENMMVQLNY